MVQYYKYAVWLQYSIDLRMNQSIIGLYVHTMFLADCIFRANKMDGRYNGGCIAYLGMMIGRTNLS